MNFLCCYTDILHESRFLSMKNQELSENIDVRLILKLQVALVDELDAVDDLAAAG